ncbi:Plipastatin synthase subunit B [Mycobacterium marinum]|uniref:hypothetical protein n=1 Tax=Mycobacterium marinum TaxID=1781 RepID=UPI000E28CC26|nr:hypothetical protein [Mycobacterium marinum]AXN45228.1 Plipastatin synthase subunit B [Mycobacterium marinum]
MILAGEAFAPTRPHLLSHHPHTRLINMYGTTETTVHATLRDITEHDTTNDTSPIGTPLHHWPRRPRQLAAPGPTRNRG